MVLPIPLAKIVNASRVGESRRRRGSTSRPGPVPVGEMLFAIGFTSGVEEACHCRCSAFGQDVLQG